MQQTNKHFRRDIQGLRGIAILLVVAFHSGIPLSGGFIGVDIFFVISGHVITALILRRLSAEGRLDFKEFYSRRIRRLLPAMALVLVAVNLVGLALLSPFGSQERTGFVGIGQLLTSANAVLYATPTGYFDPPLSSRPLLHTWSLSVEEQFYLVFPGLLVIAWKLGKRGRLLSQKVTVPAFLLIITVTSYLLSILCTYVQPVGPFNSKFAFYSSPTRAWEFSLGGLVAVATPWLFHLKDSPTRAMRSLGLALIGGSALLLEASSTFPGWIAIVPAGGTALLLASGARSTSRLVGARPLVFLGDLSYGWYLWHWPMLVYSQVLWPDRNSLLLVMVGIGSLAPAFLSLRYLENPIRFNSRLTGKRLVPTVVKCAVPVLATSLGLVAAARLTNVAIYPTTLALQQHADLKRGCSPLLPAQLAEVPDCTWPVRASLGTILLIGDSNAGHFTEPAASAANEAGFTFKVATMGGCPFTDLSTIYESDFDTRQCDRFIEEWTREIRASRPSLVFLASSSEYLNPENGVRLKERNGRTAETAPAKVKMWTTGMASMLEKLAPTPVVLIHTVPHFSAFDLASCPAFKVLRDEFACGKQLSRQEVHAQQQFSLDAERIALASAPNADGLNLTNALCTNKICSTNRDGHWLYRDGAHLSVPGAMSVKGLFAETIRMRSQ